MRSNESNGSHEGGRERERERLTQVRLPILAWRPSGSSLQPLMSVLSDSMVADGAVATDSALVGGDGPQNSGSAPSFVHGASTVKEPTRLNSSIGPHLPLPELPKQPRLRLASRNGSHSSIDTVRFSRATRPRAFHMHVAREVGVTAERGRA